jgi:phage protein D
MQGSSASVFTRSPRVRAQINGAIVDSIMHVVMIDGGTCKSSRFELTVSTSGDTSSSRWIGLANGKVTVQIFVRSHWADSDVAMFDGLADSVAIDPINGTARILGRDYSSVLINSTFQDSFCNQTASEIAGYIATRHGFDSNISATSSMVGSYQCDGYNQVLLNAHSRITSEWDLLTHLAIGEGFEMFIDGTTLVFAPAASLPFNNISIDASDVTEMKFYKRCPISDQMTVTVKSWNSWLGRALNFTNDQSSDQVAPGVPGLDADPGTEMAIVKPNLTPQDAERVAKRHLVSLSEQVLTVQISMPGEISLKPRDILTVSGGGAGLDANYVVSSVRRNYSTIAGFTQYVHGFSMGPDWPLSGGSEVSLNG